MRVTVGSGWGLGILGFLVTAACTGDGPAAPDPGAAALRLVQRIATGDVAGAVEAFDGKMKRALPPARLRRTWAALVTGQGRLGAIHVAAAKRVGASAVVVVRTALERADILVRVVVDARGRVAGLFFHPRLRVPAPIERNRGLRERSLLVGRGPEKLKGTVTIPRGRGPFPGLVLVPERAPADRDGAAGRGKFYRDLAWGLALRGVAVLRYESRGKPASRPTSTESHTPKRLVDDASDALARFRVLREVDPRRVFLLGHGLGGELGPRIAGQSGRLAGLILMAPLTRLRKNEGTLAAATALSVPLLVLHGGRDRLLGRGDLATWNRILAVNGRATHRVFPTLDHWMVPRGPGKSGRPHRGKLAAEVIETIGRWLKAAGTPRRVTDGGVRAPAPR